MKTSKTENGIRIVLIETISVLPNSFAEDETEERMTREQLGEAERFLKKNYIVLFMVLAKYFSWRCFAPYRDAWAVFSWKWELIGSTLNWKWPNWHPNWANWMSICRNAMQRATELIDFFLKYDEFVGFFGIPISIPIGIEIWFTSGIALILENELRYEFQISKISKI